ncbi:MAG: hypothetical protein M3Z16_03985 [Pseudomonadota bacterium]|nr:hypothetical protein [Pseudomonadota bacterium]
MGVLKRAAIGIAGLVLLLVVIGWLLPSTFKVSRSVDIAAPAERIYPRTADPREWQEWSVWNRRDPLFHWMALMAYGLVGNDFEAGLAAFKEVAEKP